MADGPYGLKVVDVASPNSPRIVGSCGVQGNAENIEISGNYAYVSSFYAGVQVVDIVSWTGNGVIDNPLVVGYSDTPGRATNAFADGDFVYVADGKGDLHILQAFNPCDNIVVAQEGATLTAQVPAGLSPGAYNLHVVNPGGEKAVLRNIFTVTSSGSLPSGVILLLLSDN